MPHAITTAVRRKQEGCDMSSPQVVILASMALVEIAATIAVMDEAAVRAGTVWGDASMRCWCIIGSVIGGLLSVWMLPERGETARRLAGKGACSLLLGVIVSPLLIRWADLTIDEDIVVGVSGLVSACGVTAVHLAAPIIVDAGKRWLTGKVRTIVPDDKPK